MDNLKKKLLKEITLFVKNAFLTTDLFREHFNITGAPLLNVKRHSKHNGVIPMKGQLPYKEQKINYQFHGNGCEFIFPDERVIDFDYQLPDWGYDGKIGFHRIWRFVKTTITEFENKEVLEECLAELEEDGLIIPIAPPLNFKERMAAYEGKSIEQLEEDGFFEQFNRPKHKAYYLSEKS